MLHNHLVWYQLFLWLIGNHSKGDVKTKRSKEAIVFFILRKRGFNDLVRNYNDKLFFGSL